MQKFLSFAAGIVFAAAPQISHAQDNKPVTFRVLCFDHQAEIKYVSMLSPGGGAPTQIPLPTSNFGQETKGVFGGGMVRFYAENSQPPKVVAEGKLASNDRQVFLLLPSPDPKIPYRIYALNDDEKSFAMGSTRVLNLAPVSIRLNIGGANLPPISPGALAMYPMVKTADEWGMYPALIQFENGKGGWRTVSSQSWKASDTKRNLVITLVEPKMKEPAVRLYQDLPPWREKPLPGTEQP